MPKEAILKVIADNQPLLEALKEMVEAEFALGSSINQQMSNESIGQVMRARMDGLALMRNVFKKIERYRTGSTVKVGINPGR